jgi:hypothetical protein
MEIKKDNQIPDGSGQAGSIKNLKKTENGFSKKLSKGDSIKILHELHVHKAELEAQNEELRVS